jgi:MraZ protein
VARDTKRIDAKGRFIISTRLKDLMGTDLVVTNSLDKGYLCVYSKEHFDSIKDQLSKLNSMDNNVRTIQRAIVGEALEVSTDSQGRISITNELWERINANPGDEICVFDIMGKLDICTRSFYEGQTDELLSIEGLDTKYYVEGL